MKGKPLFFFLLFFPIALVATDLKPWFPRYLEIQGHLNYLYQQYSKVKSGDASLKFKSKDHFFSGSLELAYEKYCAEIELMFSATRKHQFEPDSASATFRYQLFDDIIGDAASVVLGGTLTQVFIGSLKDLSTFHHGQFEGELTLAIGKEIPCQDTWSLRGWGVAGLGLADHGSPWLHAIAAFEKNFNFGRHLRLYGEFIKGLGGHDLNLSKKFHGYGSISHESLDCGVMYRYGLDCDSSLSLGVASRVYAKNCPKDPVFVYVSYLYPFGL